MAVKIRTAAIAIAVLAHATAEAVTIVGYNAAAHDRFSSGYATAPVPNTSPSFIGGGYNLSGVGWNPSLPTQSFAMISDEYFVYASHYAPGSSISFFSPALYAADPGNPAAAIVSYAVSGTVHRMNSPITGAPSDFSIGKLSTALNPAHGLSWYPILDLSTLGDYVGLPLIVYGHGGSGSTRLGTNNIDGFIHYDLDGNMVDDTFAYGYDFDAGPAGEAQLQGGDSGSPSFVPWHGYLAIVGTHSAIGTIDDVFYSFDNFIPIYLDQMTGAGIEFSIVPEPSRMTLLAAALAAAMLRRRRTH